MYQIFFLCFTERTVRIYVILTEFVPINLEYICSCIVMILDLTIPLLTSGLDLRGSFQTGWMSPIARWSQLVNFRVVFPDVSSFSFSVQHFFMVELTRFFHFGFGGRFDWSLWIFGSSQISSIFLILQKKFLHCHNSTKFASIPLLWFFHYGKTVGSTAKIIVSDGFLPQQGMHRSASTQRSLQFFEEATACTL